MTELCSDDSLKADIEKIPEIRDATFPKFERNIDVARQKQKEQYLNRTGGLKFTFKNGGTVLRRNMLQKTSKGQKMEDQWIEPYTVEGLDLVKGTCKLRAKDGKLLQKKKLILKTLNCIDSSPRHKHLQIMLYDRHPQLNNTLPYPQTVYQLCNQSAGQNSPV